MAATNMTFAKIVEKTRIMLGDNYREPEASVQEPVNSTETSIQEPVNSTETIDTTGVISTDLEDICEMVIQEAAQWTNRVVNTKLDMDAYTETMNDCWPVIVRCACVAYLNRGAEGLNSQSELGQQNVYNDWIKLMHSQLTNRRKVL